MQTYLISLDTDEFGKIDLPYNILKDDMLFLDDIFPKEKMEEFFNKAASYLEVYQGNGLVVSSRFLKKEHISIALQLA